MRVVLRTPGLSCLVLVLGLSAAAPARADVVSQWNERTLSFGGSSRTLAMVHIAMFDAINAIEPRYRPYLQLPVPAAGALPEAAAAAAAHGVLVRLLPGHMAALDATLALSLAALPDGVGKSRGIEYGEIVAQAMHVNRLGDNMRTFLRATEPIAKVALSTHQTLPLSSSQALLAMNPSAFAQFLETARPTPVSGEHKTRVLSSLPKEGAVTNFNASVRQKLAALTKVLRGTKRESVYEIKVIAVPQAAIALHAASVVLISEAALAVVDADELQALLAHEIGHEYVWTDYERSSRLADHDRLKDLELVCDGIAIVTLHGLGMDVSRLMTGVQKISRFNRERFGTATNERNYPTLAQRRAYARVIAAWTAGQTGGTSTGAAQSAGKSGMR